MTQNYIQELGKKFYSIQPVNPDSKRALITSRDIVKNLIIQKWKCNACILLTRTPAETRIYKRESYLKNVSDEIFIAKI